MLMLLPPEGDVRSCFRPLQYVGRYVGMYVCEQFPGAKSSPVVTLLRQSYFGHRRRGD